MPQSVSLTPVNDRSVSVRDALHDVTLTLMGTIALVVLVIFLFLRRFVATVIPTLALPVSLIGAVALLWGLNYSLDNISLLGLTLAVGLVVDDAIVMLENIMRHVENGEPPFQAALRGSREVGFTIISISILAGRGVHSDLLHARRDRAAVPRIRGGRRAGDRGLGLRLADAGADAGQPLPDRRRAQEAALARWFARSSAPSTPRWRATRARWTSPSRIGRRACDRAADLHRHRVAVHRRSRRASSPRKTSARSRSAPKPPRTPRFPRWCACRSAPPR